MEGGMMTPNVPLAAQMAAAKSAGYFFLIMDGAMMPPMAATVAGLEPLMAPKNAEATTVMSPRPPRRDPTRVEARRTSRREMPPCSMIPPASMKKGMAMKGKESTAVNIRCPMTMGLVGRLVTSMPAMEAKPMHTAMGTPRQSSTKSVRNIARPIYASFPDCFQSMTKASTALHAMSIMPRGTAA
jgi:hypothetical protein